MLKLELIHPDHPNSTDAKLDPPLGLLSIASYLKSLKDISIVVNDLSSIDMDKWVIGDADIYGITVYAPTLSLMQEIIKMCKDKNPNSIVVVGGAHPSAVPESNVFVGNDQIDYVVVGEGEKPMFDIVTALLQNKKINSKIITSSEWDNLFLLPAFDLVDVHSYHRRINGCRSVSLVTTRGCPFDCAFCGLNKLHKLGKKVKFASPENVWSQILKIKATYGISAINFQDDVFTLDRKRLFRILDLIKPLNIKFRCHGRAGHDTEEVYDRLAEAGCVQVAWGIESGSDYILDKMNKKSTVQDNYDVIKWAKKYGITSRAFIILGFPGETKETLDETKKFIIDADPDQVFASNMCPYPGTDVWSNPEKYGILKLDKDFDEYYQVGKDGCGPILSFDTEWLSREEFRNLELDFRDWIKQNVKFRGSLLDYEKELYNKEE